MANISNYYYTSDRYCCLTEAFFSYELWTSLEFETMFGGTLYTTGTSPHQKCSAYEMCVHFVCSLQSDFVVGVFVLLIPVVSFLPVLQSIGLPCILRTMSGSIHTENSSDITRVEVEK